MYTDKINKILKDFKSFTEYLSNNEVTIGKTNKYISPKFLYEINDLISVKQEEVTPRTTQLSYPMLHLFNNLVVCGKLFIEESVKGGKIALKPIERLEIYNNLNDVEKYMFLLETLCMDCDFEKLRYQSFDVMDAYSSKMLLDHLSSIKANETIIMENNIGHYSTILLYLSYFGLMDIEEREEKEADLKRNFVPDRITISELGAEIINILNDERDLEDWNIPYRKGTGEWNISFNEPFYKPFQKLFNKGELQNTLSRNNGEFIDGIYTFKVSLSRGVWSKIKLSSKHTLHDLHNYIQDAFDFDNDHLYSFFMDGVPWSEQKFTSPHDHEGPHSNEVKIGELQLYKKQKFLYLFDYGDEWRFEVEVFHIEDTDVKLLRPLIVESKGKAPLQYGGWEE